MLHSVKTLRLRYGQKAMARYSVLYYRRNPRTGRVVEATTLIDANSPEEAMARVRGRVRNLWRMSHAWIVPGGTLISRDNPVMGWNDGAIRKAAQQMIDQEDFRQAPLLADMLEEAGCTETRLLEILRTSRAPALRVAIARLAGGR